MPKKKTPESSTPTIDKLELIQKLRAALNPKKTMPKIMSAFFDEVKKSPEAAKALEEQIAKLQAKKATKKNTKRKGSDR